MTGNSLESKQPGEHHFQGGENSVHKSPEGWQLRCLLETANSSEGEAQDWGELSGVTASGRELLKPAVQMGVSAKVGARKHESSPTHIPVTRSTGQPGPRPFQAD